MKEITQEELKVILENHKHWLRKDCDGWKNMKADLSYANLKGADLRGVDLRFADLKYADLDNADLKGADLCNANLYGADLGFADLNGADLCNANLRYTNLYDANLNGVNLNNADLRYADLRGANLNDSILRGTNLHNANLKGADLNGADLRYAILRCAILKGAKNIPYMPIACPEYGSFIGFKKANNKIIMLEIPNDAKRSSGTSSKCRCNKAKVLEIQELNGCKADLRRISSNYDESFIYKVGEIVEVQNFDEDRWNECSTGIHFFINRQEAVDYDII